MTDAEIIKAWEYWEQFDKEAAWLIDVCSGVKDDRTIEMLNEQRKMVRTTVKVFALIKRQQAEIEQFAMDLEVARFNLEMRMEELSSAETEIEQLKVESCILSQKRITFPEAVKIAGHARVAAIREFAERLKLLLTPYPDCDFREPVTSKQIDTLVKEMIGEIDNG